MPTTTDTPMRRCIGSTRFGIDAHDADPADFPVQPSQRDGLGRMCHTHWRIYTNALRKAAVARRAETAEPAPEPEVEPRSLADLEATAPEPAPEPEAPAPRRRRVKAPADQGVAEADAA